MNKLQPLLQVSEAISQETIVTEATGDIAGSRQHFLKGVFSQGDIKNNNGRIYPTSLLEREISAFQTKIVGKNAFGEFGHPKTVESIREINAKNVSHRIVELEKIGNDFIGKSVLVDEGLGKMAIAMVESGGILSISSRGLGSVNKKNNMVENNFKLFTFDIVFDPGMPKAQMEAVMESKDFFLEERYFSASEWDNIDKNRKEMLEGAFFRANFLAGLKELGRG